SHSLHLVKEGRALAAKVERFALPIQSTVAELPAEHQSGLLESLLKLIYQLNQEDVITPQHMCLNCRFYERKPNTHYCHLVESPLKAGDLRVDCPEFEFPGE